MKYLAMLDRDRPHVRFQQRLRRRIEQTQKVIFSGHISSSTGGSFNSLCHQYLRCRIWSDLRNGSVCRVWKTSQELQSCRWCRGVMETWCRWENARRRPSRAWSQSEVPRALPPFSTRRKSTIFSSIVRQNSVTCRMVGSNRGPATISNFSFRR